jgi:hypothetical protein
MISQSSAFVNPHRPDRARSGHLVSIPPQIEYEFIVTINNERFVISATKLQNCPPSVKADWMADMRDPETGEYYGEQIVPSDAIIYWVKVRSYSSTKLSELIAMIEDENQRGDWSYAEF